MFNFFRKVYLSKLHLVRAKVNFIMQEAPGADPGASLHHCTKRNTLDKAASPAWNIFVSLHATVGSYDGNATNKILKELLQKIK